MSNQNIRPAVKHSSIDIFLSALPANGTASFVFQAPEYGLIEQLLDVGGGNGMMASLLKQFNPHLKITVFDRADLCESALDLFREKSQNEDLGAHAGDILFEPFPSGFEAIQLSGILETLRPTQIHALLRKVFNALPGGGLLLIYMQIKPGSHSTRTGRSVSLRPVSQYQDWLQERGFTLMACRRCAGMHMLLSAVK